MSEQRIKQLLGQVGYSRLNKQGKFTLYIPSTFTIDDVTLLCTLIQKRGRHGYGLLFPPYFEYFSVIVCNNPEVEAFVNLYLLSL